MPPRMQVKSNPEEEAENDLGAQSDDTDDTEQGGLSDEEIVTIVRGEIADSVGALTTSTLSTARRSALKYYMGDPYGDEVDGQSQVVTSEFRDTVESLLPQLIKIFMASDTVVQFSPDEPSDEEGAKQATDYINHIFMQENGGFILLYTMFKDALMFKNGIVKIYWDETQKVTKETYRGLLPVERDAVLQGEGVTPIAYTAYESKLPGQPQAGMFGADVPVQLCDLTIKRVNKIGKAVVKPVPPEEFMITRRTAAIQGSRFVGQRTPKTVSELIEMGVPRDVAEGLGGSQGEGEFSLERQQRFFYDGDSGPASDSLDKSAKTVWVYETYIMLDVDKDGIAEPWKVTLGGDQYTLLFKEEHEGPWPFESVSPILMPHKFYGLSIYDLVNQWQRIMSTLVRQYLNNIYGINNNRIAVNADRVNLDDLMTNRPNQLVRTVGNPAESIMPMQPMPLGAVLVPGMEYFNSVREKATGVTSYNQGLDADSLNKTASGISQIMGAAQERVLLIARIFAETGICGIFQQLLQLTCKHQDKAKVVRLRDKWVTIDPSAWNSGMNANTDVALGTNNRDQMLLHLNQVLAIQKEVMTNPGTAQMVTPKNLYNTLAKLVENSGLKHVESYFTDPDTTQPAQPTPSPEEIKAQADIKKNQDKLMADQQAQQAEHEATAREKMVSVQTDLAKHKGDMVNAEKERQLKLRIAREANMTTLITAESKAAATATNIKIDSAGKASEEPAKPAPTGKSRPGVPTNFKINRGPDGFASEIVPIYEEIKDEADPEDAP